MDKEQIKQECMKLKSVSGRPVFWCYGDTDMIVEKAVDLAYADGQANTQLIKGLEETIDITSRGKQDEIVKEQKLTASYVLAIIKAKHDEIASKRTHEESKLQLSYQHEITDLTEIMKAIKDIYKVE